MSVENRGPLDSENVNEIAWKIRASRRKGPPPNSLLLGACVIIQQQLLLAPAAAAHADCSVSSSAIIDCEHVADDSVSKCIYKPFHLCRSPPLSPIPPLLPVLLPHVLLHRSCRGLALERASGFSTEDSVT